MASADNKHGDMEEKLLASPPAYDVEGGQVVVGNVIVQPVVAVISSTPGGEQQCQDGLFPAKAKEGSWNFGLCERCCTCTSDCCM